MNVKKNLFFYLFIFMCFIFALTIGRVICYRFKLSEVHNDVRQFEQELRQYRVRNELLEDSKRELEQNLETTRNIIDEAKGIVADAGGSLDRMGNSIYELRNGLKELQKYVAALENCLWESSDSSSRDGDCSDNNKE